MSIFRAKGLRFVIILYGNMWYKTVWLLSMCAFVNALDIIASNTLSTGLHRWDVPDVLHTRWLLINGLLKVTGENRKMLIFASRRFAPMTWLLCFLWIMCHLVTLERQWSVVELVAQHAEVVVANQMSIQC